MLSSSQIQTTLINRPAKSRLSIDIAAIITRFKGSFEASINKIREHQADYRLFAISKHHGKDLSCPSMAPQMRRTLLDARDNGDSEIEQIKAREKAFDDLFQRIEERQALTEDDREKITAYKVMVSITLGDKNFYSKDSFLFDRLLQTKDKLADETLEKISQRDDTDLLKLIPNLNAENIKEKDIAFITKCLLAKLKSMIRKALDDYERPLEYSRYYANRYYTRDNIGPMMSPITMEEYDRLRTSKTNLLHQNASILMALESLQNSTFDIDLIQATLNAFKSKLQSSVQTAFLIDAVLERLKSNITIPELSVNGMRIEH